MKKLIFLLALFTTLAAEAQFNRGLQRNNRIRPSQTSAGNGPALPKFDPVKYAGIFKFETEKVLKKIGVKESSDLGTKVKVIFAKYHKGVNDVERLNTFTLSEYKATVEATQREALKTKDYSEFEKVKKQMDEAFKPMKDQIQKEEEKLEAALKNTLSAKQYKKWVKYQNKIKN